MARAFASAVVAAAPDVVWGLLSDFGAWHRWLPRIVSTSLEGDLGRAPVGSVRVLRLDDGSVARERLLACDDGERRMAYCFDYAHPFPVRGYLATIEVHPVTLTGASFIGWTGRFDADAGEEDAVRATFGRIYSAFLSQLADHLRPRAISVATAVVAPADHRSNPTGPASRPRKEDDHCQH